MPKGYVGKGKAPARATIASSGTLLVISRKAPDVQWRKYRAIVYCLTPYGYWKSWIPGQVRRVVTKSQRNVLPVHTKPAQTLQVKRASA